MHHSQKKGKYLSKDRTVLCSKCAVLLASQGYQVEHLENSDNWAKQLDSFMAVMQQLKNQIVLLQSQLDGYQTSLQQRLQDQISTHQTFFSSLKNLISLLAKQTHSQLMTSYSRTKQQMKKSRQDLDGYCSRILLMYHDVKDNKQKIVKWMDEQGYRKIYGQYSQQRASMQKGIQDIRERVFGFKIPHFVNLDKKMNNIIQILDSNCILIADHKDKHKLLGSYSTVESMARPYSKNNQNRDKEEQRVASEEFSCSSNPQYQVNSFQAKPKQCLFDSPCFKQI